MENDGKITYSFTDFINYASDIEKDAVYKEVMEEVSKMSDEIIQKHLYGEWGREDEETEGIR